MNQRRHKRSQRQQRPQQVRIIGGEWRRTPLPVVDAEGLRPTSDRVRETVFNWINHLWHGEWVGKRCLDMFAGTGAFGFEAASRGAQGVVMIESSAPVWRQLESIKAKLKAEQVRTVRGDAQHIAKGMAERGERFDMIFVDPPYQQQILFEALSVSGSLLTSGGLVYVESNEPLDALEDEEAVGFLKNWSIIRAGRAGIVFFYILERVK